MEGNWDTQDYFVVVRIAFAGNRILLPIGAHRNVVDAWSYFNSNYPQYARNAAVLIADSDARTWLETLKEYYA